jgi:peptidyl-prolyl cis-trans isomerase C
MRFPTAAILAVAALSAPAVSAEVLASVGDATLTWDDLVAMVGGEENRQYLGVTNLAEAEDILRSWVREELIVQAADDEDLAADPEVAAAIDQAVRQIILDAYLSRATADVEISRLDVENYVASWAPSYKVEIHARHILVPSAELAQSLLSRVRSGESFDALAAEYSICPSAADGGDLGWLMRGQAVLPFEEAAFSLDPGEISGVVQTSMGYHIIKVLESRPISPTPADADILALAEQELVQDAQEEALLSLLDTLEATRSVTLYPDRLLAHLQD